MFDAFYSTLSNIIDKHIPLKQLSEKDTKHIKTLDNPSHKNLIEC